MRYLLIVAILLIGGAAASQAGEKGGFCGSPYDVAEDFVGCFGDTCECATVASACKHAVHAAHHCGNVKAKARAKVEKVECEGNKECEAEVKESLKEELLDLKNEAKAARAFCNEWKAECDDDCAD